MMVLTATPVQDQLTDSMSAMLLLHSSCQGIIEATIAPVDSSWYDQINSELGAAEEIVVEWRQSGYLYFQQDILEAVVACGQSFLDAQDKVNGYYNTLDTSYSDHVKQLLVAELTQLEQPLTSMIDQLSGYSGKLAALEANMQKPHSDMNTTIAGIQAQEATIKSEIDLINTKIALMQKQIQTDRKAIAKAKAARDRGIVETIFGILFAPFTGGASLILAGVGVASIVEGEEKINSMKSQISTYQSQIVGDQVNLNKDQKEVATLGALTMSTAIAIEDMSMLASALDTLRVSWGAMLGELQNVVTKTDSARTSQEAVVGQAWFHAACNEWNVLIDEANDLNGRTISTTRITIG